MFGVSTNCLADIPLGDALERLSSLTGMVEVVDDGLHFLESGDLLFSYDFSYSFHAPARSVNIASRLEPIRQASVEVLIQCFTVAAEVGAPVVIHPGYAAWTQDRTPAIEAFGVSLSELKAAAADLSVTFFVENMPNWEHFFLHCPDELGMLQGTGLALDVGHAHICGCLDAFLKHPAAHYHLHDNEGVNDSHLAIGAGTIDFGPVMDAVRRDGVVPIIEVGTFEGVVESIRMLETYGF
jgi:sugar phosphate isomerase/epimerase